MASLHPSTRKPNVCLILDNPLRDLDGLILLAWQLAQRGANAWLVPMYEQGFDVAATGADFVLLNYIRANNRDHAVHYMHNGTRVGVLDTEGMAGKSSEQFADLVAAGGGASLVDLYCVWGEGQYRALLNKKLVSAERLMLTGCARYDYCAEPWRQCLTTPSITPGYILINTNFACCNSQFARSSEEELGALLRGGYTEDFAREYLRDERAAHAGMIALIQTLVAHFPHQQFVLRPHPFESSECYTQAIQASNFTVRQEGTSIEWLNHARALIQLNCLTSIEASAFGIPSLTPSWLNTPALLVPLSSKLSSNIASEQELFKAITEILSATATLPVPGNSGAIKEYLWNDGNAAHRVAEAIVKTLHHSEQSPTMAKVSPRFTALHWLRRILGYSNYAFLQTLYAGKTLRERKQRKHFSIDTIASMLDRIARASPSAKPVYALPMKHVSLTRPRLASGLSICVTTDAVSR